MRVFEITSHIIVNVAPAHVWAILDDFSGWPRWMPDLKGVRVSLLDEGPPTSGYRFRLSGRFAHAELKVVEFDTMRRGTRFRMNIPPLTGANFCFISPYGDGQFRIDRVDQIDLFGPVASILDATQRERFMRLSLEFLRALKDEAERHADAPSS